MGRNNGKKEGGGIKSIDRTVITYSAPSHIAVVVVVASHQNNKR
jgi:hypothetical protein